MFMLDGGRHTRNQWELTAALPDWHNLGASSMNIPMPSSPTLKYMGRTTLRRAFAAVLYIHTYRPRLFLRVLPRKLWYQPDEAWVLPVPITNPTFFLFKAARSKNATAGWQPAVVHASMTLPQSGKSPTQDSKKYQISTCIK